MLYSINYVALKGMFRRSHFNISVDTIEAALTEFLKRCKTSDTGKITVERWATSFTTQKIDYACTGFELKTDFDYQASKFKGAESCLPQ